MNNAILQFPDCSKPFASNCTIGVMLSPSKIGNDLYIAFLSRPLNQAEINYYSTIETELLAIVWNVTHFRLYLFTTKFTIATDLQPLKSLLSIIYF